MSSTLYSQTTQLIKGDTNICFTLPKARIIIKQSYKVKEQAEVIQLCDMERTIYDSITKNNEDIISNQAELINDGKEVQKLKDQQIKEEKQKTELANKETRKQKAGKIVAIVVGTAVAILEAVLFITTR
ncbi:MAG: hypothetical protein V4547_17690 [Bacteroidota bacterium]